MVAVLVNKIAKRETIKRKWFNSDVSHAEYIQFDEISKHWSHSLFSSNNAPSRYTSGILSSLNLNFFKRVYLRNATLTSHKQTTDCLKWITLSRLNILHKQIIKNDMNIPDRKQLENAPNNSPLSAGRRFPETDDDKERGVVALSPFHKDRTPDNAWKQGRV